MPAMKLKFCYKCRLWVELPSSSRFLWTAHFHQWSTIFYPSFGTTACQELWLWLCLGIVRTKKLQEDLQRSNWVEEFHIWMILVAILFPTTSKLPLESPRPSSTRCWSFLARSPLIRQTSLQRKSLRLFLVCQSFWSSFQGLNPRIFGDFQLLDFWHLTESLIVEI